MPTAVSYVNLQYDYTIGRGEQFGRGFPPRCLSPVVRATCCTCSVVPQYRPEGTRITVCTVDEEYVTAFARGVPAQGHTNLTSTMARLSGRPPLPLTATGMSCLMNGSIAFPSSARMATISASGRSVLAAATENSTVPPAWPLMRITTCM